jgi:NAD(P)-dependent dehydrogenase (short-subunit alcohol dehydrogenase family)
LKEGDGVSEPSNSTAIVTGASGGIGLAVVHRLLASGVRVFAWARDVDPLNDAVGKAAGRLIARRVDVTDCEALEAALHEAEHAFGGVSIVVNSAGVIGAIAPAPDYERLEWDRVLAVNLTSVFEICRRAAPPMAARGYGRVINITSVSGLRGQAQAAAYGASKAGVIGLTRGLAKEYARTGVTFNCVAPAVIETPMLLQLGREAADQARARIPMGRGGQPDEVAAMVAWIASSECSFTTGAVFDASGGRLAW